MQKKKNHIPFRIDIQIHIVALFFHPKNQQTTHILFKFRYE